MESTTTPHMLARFADHVERDGIALVPAELLATLVSAARSVGASEVLVGVLVDPTEPTVTRERAFAKIAARLIGASTPAVATCSRSPRGSSHARGQTPGVTPTVVARV